MAKRGLAEKLLSISLNKAEERMYHFLIEENPNDRPLINQQYKFELGKLILNEIRTKKFNPQVNKALTNILLKGVFFGTRDSRRYVKEYGENPPKFMTISPLAWCNLHCKGCYASAMTDELLAQGKSKHSWMKTGEHVIDFDLFNKILRDGKKNLGMRFFVISGGEPFLYKSNGKDLYDVFGSNKDSYFMVYTNGTFLAQKENAKRLGKLGNVTPAFSVEGFKEETEDRRGKGVYKKIIQGIDNIKEEGIPFGLSFTATREDVNVLLNKEKREKFVDFYFKEKGASYMWIFQLMPIGNAINAFDSTLTTSQRRNLIDVVRNMIFEDHIFVADFWNAALASDGCISAARPGGYFFIDWDKHIYPCVFNRFTSPELNNVEEVYSKGKTLADAINTSFFKDIRKWIDNYGYKKPAMEMKNQYAPCPVRDHYYCEGCDNNLVKIIQKDNARTPDPAETKIMLGKKYKEKMEEIADSFIKVTDPLWEKHKKSSPIKKSK